MSIQWKIPLICAALGCGLLLTGPALCVDEGQQSQMLKQMFKLPQPEWAGILRENSGLLDQSFFDRLDARIRWSAEANQIDDAVRFSLVGDLACDAAGRKGGYRLGLINAFQKAGNDDMAKMLIDNILLTHPNSSEARYLRAAYRRAGLDVQGAIEDYQYLVGQSFQLPQTYYYLGACYLALDKRREAEQAFRQSAALGWEPAKLDLEKLNYKPVADGVPFQDIEVENPVAMRQVNPADHAAYFRRAEDAARQGRVTEAIQNYEDACAADPKQPAYWISLGTYRYKVGTPDRAAMEILCGLKLNSKDADGWRYMGCCYERVFDRSQTADALTRARQSFEQAVKLNPGDQVSRMALDRLSSKKPRAVVSPVTPASDGD